MGLVLSPNTEAVLLLTAPLLTGGKDRSTDVLTHGEYKKLARRLHSLGHEPADLMGADADELVRECADAVVPDKVERALARGFLLSQAVERWQARSIWVVSWADEDYPQRLRDRLKDDAPPVLYGCGEIELLGSGGLAVVGSRHVDEDLVEYTEGVGRLVARAGLTVVSGGARGIDQASMRGALNADGKVVGVLADSLERTALNRENRTPLVEGALVIASPYDPAAGFNVGNAMQRNKSIYGLADAALVVSSDFETGGTWAGAVEQLERLRLVPVYVRSTGDVGKGLMALRRKGALPWPEPEAPDDLAELLAGPPSTANAEAAQGSMALEEAASVEEEPASRPDVHRSASEASADYSSTAPAADEADDELPAEVRERVLGLAMPTTEDAVATELGVSVTQARAWLRRLVEDGLLVRRKPARYDVRPLQGKLV